jgi:hypothetical protein
VAEGLDPARLVGIEPLDAEQAQPIDDQVRDPGRERLDHGPALPELADVHERRLGLGVGGQLVEEGPGIHWPRC